MIKIHAGKFKGQKIKRVGVDTTKETASMVREAVFNMLFKVNGNVLDLFAGSGSYGITALSLGASNVVFVDNNKKAWITIKNNLEKLNVINSNVYLRDYISFLNKNEIKFNYVFLDPPYDFNNYQNLLSSLTNHLENEGIIVLELSKDVIFDFIVEGLEIINEKIYSSKKIIIYKVVN